MPREYYNKRKSQSHNDFFQLLGDITWVNDDNLQANQSLLEGLRSGFIGYTEDRIIQPIRLNPNPQNCSTHPLISNKTHEFADLKQAQSDEKTCSSVIPASILPERNEYSLFQDESFNNLQLALYGTSALGQPLRISGPTLKRNSALTVRPTIGEERKAWIMETRKAYYLDTMGSDSNNLPNGNRKEIPFHDISVENKSKCKSGSYSLHNSQNEMGSSNQSCTYLFQHRANGGMKPSEIRLSPRIEKLDKLIPTTSKEFLDTFKIVNTLSPRRNDEHPKSQEGTPNSTFSDDQNDEYDDKEEAHQQKPDGDHGTKQGYNSGRSYKEVFLYGPPSYANGDPQSLEDVLNCHSHSRTCFPSLAKMTPSGDANWRDRVNNSPPLWSSILQRNPMSSTSNYESNACDSNKFHSVNTSSNSSSFDCGFCRTNSQPEDVYRSHPLRVNDIVVCPTLRKYICCFCGATGDQAHTIKYCPKNPLGFFAKKSRQNVDNLPSLKLEMMVPVECCDDCCVIKGDEKESTKVDQECKSEPEVVPLSEEGLETELNSSGIWIEAKSKGRKKRITKGTSF